MKNLVLIILLLDCSIESQLSLIRPDATYIVHSGYLEGIEWTDKNSKKPTQDEMDNANIQCQSFIANTAKQQNIQTKLDTLNKLGL